MAHRGLFPLLYGLNLSKTAMTLGRKIIFRTVYSVLPKGEVFAEGKVGVVLRRTAMPNGDSVGHLVQRTSEVIDRVKHDARYVIRKTHVKQKMMGTAAIRIVIDRIGVWLISREEVDLGFEICDMVICATENAFRAGEDVSDGVIRSHKKP
jgi:hypothetical protein